MTAPLHHYYCHRSAGQWAEWGSGGATLRHSGLATDSGLRMNTSVDTLDPSDRKASAPVAVHMFPAPTN